MSELRTRLLGAFASYAEQVFAARPHVRSLLLCLARGYEAELEASTVASEREIPMWPHRCAAWFDDDLPWIAGESCPHCYAPERGETVPQLALGATSWELGEALGTFCRPTNDNNDELAGVTSPVALAQRGKPVAIVGELHDPAREMLRGRVTTPAPLDRRALELLDQIAAEPRDDGPRRVLADHLLERNDPRGEYIALALSPAHDADAAALLAQHRWSWIKPLGAVVPGPCARFERGLLAAVDVWACDNDAIAAVRGAIAWRTVERLRFLAGSRTDLLDEQMRALRDVGPLDAFGLAQLGRLALAENIERLVAIADEPERLARLDLPRIRELVVTCARDRLPVLARAAWWPRLERLTLVEADARRPPPELAQRPPWIVIAAGSAATATGWQLAYGPHNAVEITLTAWDTAATLGQLRELVAGLPERSRITLVPSKWYAPDRAEAQLLSRTSEHTVDIAR